MSTNRRLSSDCHALTKRLHHRSRLGVSALVVAVTASTAFIGHGCRPNDPPVLLAGTRPNVILIVMDTTRADRCGCYGDDRGLTPNLDALAAAGARFDRARAHAPWTLPSVASLLTSVSPIVHGAGGRLGEFRPLPPDRLTLAEALRREGYATGCIVNVMFLGQRFGLTRGFDHVDPYDEATNSRMRPAGETTAAALRWIESVRDRAFFALVHYFDPHLTYAPPEPFRSRYADPGDTAPAQAGFGTEDDMVRLRRGELRLTREDIARLEKLYDGEVAYMDEQIGRLASGVRELGLGEYTIFVLVADHGEEFFDHGGFEHGHSLFEEIVRVPLIFAGADVPAGVVVTQDVGLIDVAPTLCELAEVPAPSDFAGRSLVPALAGLPIANRPTLFEGNMWGPPLQGLLRGAYQFIRAPGGNSLFNLDADPQQRHNLIERQPDLARQMDQELTLLRTTLAPRPPQTATALSPEERRRLCALGYLDCGG